MDLLCAHSWSDNCTGLVLTDISWIWSRGVGCSGDSEGFVDCEEDVQLLLLLGSNE